MPETMVAPSKPQWVRTAERQGIPAAPSAVGWVLALNKRPIQSEKYLDRHGENVFRQVLGHNDFELLRLARRFRQQLARSDIELAPIDERHNEDLPAEPVGRYPQLVEHALVDRLSRELARRKTPLPAATVKRGVRLAVANGPGRAEAANGMFLATVLAGGLGRRQYVYFTRGGPWVLYDTKVNGQALADANFDERDVEMIELGVEIVGLLVSIAGIAVGAGALKAEGAEASKAAFRDFWKQLLKSPKLKGLLKTLITALLGVDAHALAKGDKEAVSEVLANFLKLLKGVWDEGLLKKLFALLGFEATIVAAVMFILWWFGIGELFSMIFLAVGIGMLIADLATFVVKLQDWDKRKQAAPATPAPAK